MKSRNHSLSNGDFPGWQHGICVFSRPIRTAPSFIVVTSETQKEGIQANPFPIIFDVICGKGLYRFRLSHGNIYYYIPKIAVCKLAQTLPCETARK
jgi:hypothetical protein